MSFIEKEQWPVHWLSVPDSTTTCLMWRRRECRRGPALLLNLGCLGLVYNRPSKQVAVPDVFRGLGRKTPYPGAAEDGLSWLEAVSAESACAGPSLRGFPAIENARGGPLSTKKEGTVYGPTATYERPP